MFRNHSHKALGHRAALYHQHFIWKWWSGWQIVCSEELCHTLTSLQKPVLLFLTVCTCTFDHIYCCLVRIPVWQTPLKMRTLETEIIKLNSLEESFLMKFIRSESISDIVPQFSSVMYLANDFLLFRIRLW